MSLLSDKFIAKLTKIRKCVFRAAVWLLIAGIVAGVVLILVSDVEAVSEIVGKTMGTIFLAALMMIVSAISIRLLESLRPSVRFFAGLTLCTTVLWAVLWGTAIWAWEPVFYSCTRDDAACAEYVADHIEYYDNPSLIKCPDYIAKDCDFTMVWRITMVITYISVFTLFASAVMNMYEGNRKDVIRPLKIVSLILAGYVCFFRCFTTLGDASSIPSKMEMLAVFAGAIDFIVVIVAFVISRIERHRLRDAAASKGRNGKTPEQRRIADRPDAKNRILTKETVDDGEGQTSEPGQSATTSRSVPGLDLSMYADQMPEESATSKELGKDGAPGKLKIGPSRMMGDTDHHKSEAELRAEVEDDIRREYIEKEMRAKMPTHRNADGGYTDDPAAADPYPDGTYDGYAENQANEEYLLNPFGVKQASASQDDEDIINAVNELNEYIDDNGKYNPEE